MAGLVPATQMRREFEMRARRLHREPGAARVSGSPGQARRWRSR